MEQSIEVTKIWFQPYLLLELSKQLMVISMSTKSSVIQTYLTRAINTTLCNSSSQIISQLEQIQQLIPSPIHGASASLLLTLKTKWERKRLNRPICTMLLRVKPKTSAWCRTPWEKRFNNHSLSLLSTFQPKKSRLWHWQARHTLRKPPSSTTAVVVTILTQPGAPVATLPKETVRSTPSARLAKGQGNALRMLHRRQPPRPKSMWSSVRNHRSPRRETALPLTTNRRRV